MCTSWASKGFMFTAVLGLGLTLGLDAQAQTAGTWHRVNTQGPLAFSHGGVATDGTDLYYFGGDDSTTWMSVALLRYSPATNTWHRLGDFPQQVSRNSGQFINGTLYSFGGINYPPIPGGGRRIDDAIFKYPLSANGWVPAASTLQDHGRELATVFVGGKVLVIGGLPNSSGRQTDQVDSFDPVTEALTPVAPLPTVLSYHSAVFAPATNKVYVFGGVTRDSHDAGMLSPFTYEYDPTANTWAMKSNIQLNGVDQPRMGTGAFELGGKIFLVGGAIRDGGAGPLSTTDAVLVYDPVADSWSAGPPLTAPRRFPGTLSLGGKGYVYGGDNFTGDGGVPFSLEIYEPPAPDGGVDAGFDGGVDAGFDAGFDAGLPVFDAGAPDAAVFDAGLADAGVADAAVLDAGVFTHDAGLFDAGLTFDAGTTVADSGVFDAGPATAVDAGVSHARADSGLPFDAGSDDTGAKRVLRPGCGCGSVDPLFGLVGLGVLLGLARRRSVAAVRTATCRQPSPSDFDSRR